MGSDTRSKLSGPRGLVPGPIEARPDLRLVEVRSTLAEQGVDIGYGTIWRFFDKEGLSLKKTMHASE